MTPSRQDSRDSVDREGYDRKVRRLNSFCFCWAMAHWQSGGAHHRPGVRWHVRRLGYVPRWEPPVRPETALAVSPQAFS